MLALYDLPQLAAVMAAGMFVTALTFFVLRLLRAGLAASRAISAGAFPALLVAFGILVEMLSPGLNGFVMVGLGSLGFFCLPVTILTAVFLARRFPER